MPSLTQKTHTMKQYRKATYYFVTSWYLFSMESILCILILLMY